MNPINIQPVIDRWEAWWNQQNTNPVIYAIFPEGDFSMLNAYRKDWMSPGLSSTWSSWGHEHLISQGFELHLKTGDDRYLKEVIDYIKAFPKVTGHAAEGFPFLHPSLGAACLSGLLTGYSKFHADTVWFERPQAFEWVEIEGLFEQRNAYAKTAEHWITEIVRQLQDQFIISMPDFGTDCDILSPMRHTQQFLMDTYDEPEQIHKTLRLIHKEWVKWQQWSHDLIAPNNHGGHSVVMRYLGGEPVHLAYCDCSAMISPAMFEEFVLPGLKDECERYPGRTVFHLDGPGEIPHVDLICSTPGLFAIQWVEGAGKPDSLDPTWDSLYTQILNHGKRICLCQAPANPEALVSFFKRFPKKEFVVPLSAPNRETAEAVIRAVQD